MQGVIKKIVRERGFGFITGEDKKEYFFHQSMLVGTPFDTIEEGDRVHFEEDTQRKDGKGPRAAEVQVI